MKVNVCALPSYRKHISCKVVDKVLCSVRLTANCLESDSQDLLDEKKREACLQGKFVVKMYRLKEQDFLDCRSGALAGSANAA